MPKSRKKSGATSKNASALNGFMARNGAASRKKTGAKKASSMNGSMMQNGTTSSRTKKKSASKGRSRKNASR